MLATGSRLGPYEIVSRIGAGGMGEVWRARDTRLERSVAIKVLPTDFASNAQLRVRFDREARTISQLNHPHICTVHDVGHEDGVDYLVLELLEGESLADRLTRGPLPLADVVRFGVEISEALDRAHRAGIVHRDLKPGNVMITRGGAKLLDFGLAKSATILGAQRSVSGGEEGATEAKPLTAQGTILGTFQYMSPEQLEGSELDPRSDIFSLGALLYEMTTGRRAFEGKTKTSLIAAIVGGEPPRISSLQPLTPPALEHVIAKCLEKDPDNRWQSAHDIAEELKWIGEAGSQAGVSHRVAVSRSVRTKAIAALAIVATLIAIAAGVLAFRLQQDLTAARKPLHFDIVPPPGQVIQGVTNATAAISPDGEQIAYVTSKDGIFQLCVRALDSDETRYLVSSSSMILFPFWSPDSASLGFFNDRKLKRISAAGGAAQALAAAPAGRGGAWNRDEVIVFAPDIFGALLRVSASGGRAEPVTKPPSEEWSNRNPSFLPDGKHFVFIERHAEQGAFGRLMASSLDGGPSKMVIEEASNAHYAGGYLFFVNDQNLVAQKFDPEELRLSGPMIPVAQQIAYNNPRDVGNFSVSESALVYRPFLDARSRIVRVGRDGQESPLIADVGRFNGVLMTFSRDGRKAMLLRREEGANGADVWVLDLERGQLTRSTFLSTTGILNAALSPDGERLVVSADAGPSGKGRETWIQPVSGTSRGEPIKTERLFFVTDWSLDGRFLLGSVQETKTQMNVAWIDLSDRQKIHPLVSGPGVDVGPVLSPDGKWVAYSSDESGRPEIYVVDFPQALRKWQVSKNGGNNVKWAAGGAELWFRSGDAVYVAPVQRKVNDVTFGEPKQLLKLDRGVFLTPSPDGTFALGLRPVEEIDPPPIKVVRNWKLSGKVAATR